MNYKEKFLKSINKIAEKEIDKVNINQHYLEVLESQDKEIERLNNIINKAIEYIEKNTRIGGINKDKKYFKLPSQAMNILEILEGGKDT